MGGWERKVEPRKFLGELLSDGEGGKGVWAAPPGFWHTKSRSALWPQKTASIASTNRTNIAGVY